MFGADDPYLNAHVARRFARLFPAAELNLIDNARHYVQVDEPEAVAKSILLRHPLTGSTWSCSGNSGTANPGN
ncbi:MAG TPA: alpha/beta hydrolase [Pseudonocardiaceae bacterium]